MNTYINTREVAKLVREALKSEFPGTKFSVRCGTGTGSAWISVHYTDGPRYDDVRDVTCRFEGRHFNGMTDSYDEVDNDYLCDGINVTRNISPEAAAWAAYLIESEHGEIHLNDVICVAGVRFHVRHAWITPDVAARQIAYQVDLRGVDLTTAVFIDYLTNPTE